MKILIITKNTPYPLSDGGKVAQFTIIDYLRHKCSITLLLFADSHTELLAINKLKSIWVNVNIEVIIKEQPKPLAPKTFYEKLLHFFQKNLDHIKYRINKILDKKKQINEINEDVDFERLQYLLSFSQPKHIATINAIVKLVNAVKPDLVQLDFVETIDFCLCIPNKIKKIFVQHEIRFRRIETEIETIKNRIGSYGEYAQNLCELLEISLLNNFDGIITFSEDDKERLLQKLSVQNIYSSPFAVMSEEIKEIQDKNFEIKKLVFVGYENHSPNRDAVEWYANDMSKEIYEKFGFVLHVIGNWTSAFKLKYTNNPGILFAGFVENLSEYCSNSIMIVPLRIGSGIRTKILHSMAWGVPIISTNTGSEGIIENDKIFLHANNTDEFVKAIHKIIEDVQSAKRMTLNAQSVLKKHYSQEAAGEKRFLFYKSIIETNIKFI